jgi:hypothetical protein
VNTSSSRRLGAFIARGLGIALLLIASRATAQPAGILSGVVVDATSKAPLSGAVVTARSPVLLGEQSAVTDETGAFEMTMLSPGTYALAVRHDGFLPFAPQGLVVPDRRVRVRLQLIPDVEPDTASSPPTPVDFDDATMTKPAMISGSDDGEVCHRHRRWRAQLPRAEGASLHEQGGARGAGTTSLSPSHVAR